MNAEEELFEMLKEAQKHIEDIDYYTILYRPNYYEIVKKPFWDLKFNYDNGFGSQELYGFVVFKDGTWLERHEYDGSEWWEYKRTPTKEEVEEFNV